VCASRVRGVRAGWGHAFRLMCSKVDDGMLPRLLFILLSVCRYYLTGSGQKRQGCVCAVWCAYVQCRCGGAVKR